MLLVVNLCCKIDCCNVWTFYIIFNDILSILFMILVEKEYDLLTVYQNRHSPSPKDNASNQFMINLYTCTKDSKCSNGYL